MKQLLSGLFLLAALSAYAQITTTHMGDIYVGKKIADVEKDLGLKIPIVIKEGTYGFYFKTDYKGEKYELYFTEGFYEGEETYQLTEVSTVSPTLKTLSGMGIGNTLEDLWKTYKKYSIEVFWQWDTEKDQPSKTDRIFQIIDRENYTVLQFLIRNNKVYQIRIMVNEIC